MANIVYSIEKMPLYIFMLLYDRIEWFICAIWTMHYLFIQQFILRVFWMPESAHLPFVLFFVLFCFVSFNSLNGFWPSAETI